jgi:hypothetical protein
MTRTFASKTGTADSFDPNTAGDLLHPNPFDGKRRAA